MTRERWTTMKDILKILFVDNPYLPEEVCKFCKQLPEFQEAEQAYEAAAEQLRAQLGPAQFDAFDETLTWYLALYANAYYRFGLSLRQEVLSAWGLEG